MRDPDDYEDGARWRALANCADVPTDAFFPTQGELQDEALLVCSGCVVRSECLDFAFTSGETFGIWGGTSERQRMRIRRVRRGSAQRGVA